MIDKEPGVKKSLNPLKLLAKAGVPIIASGLALSGQGNGQVSEISPTLPSDTPIPAVDNVPSFQDAKNQVIPVEAPEVTVLKDSIANKYGIEIQTFDDISQNPATKLLYGFENFLPMNQEWNEDNLELLTRVLEYVPSDFYKPRNGEKVQVILGPTSHCGHDIKGFTPKYPYEVMLSYQLFNPKKPLTAALVTAHEFGHLMTTESCNTPLSPNYLGKLEEILGENFAKTQEKLPEKIKIAAEELGAEVTAGGAFSSIDSLTPEGEESFRLTRLNYATKNPKEFMGVLFESYFLGKDYFYRMYMPFFGTKTDDLYDFVKGIYKGREFPDYHTTASDLAK